MPGDASFGEVDLGGSAARRMEITNTTTSPLTLTEVSTSGSLVTSGDALPLTIAPGETANLSVELAPTTEGDVSGTVEFLAADETTPVAVFRATGKGVRPNKLASSAATASFGDVALGATAQQEVTLTNGGTASVKIASLMVSAAGVAATGLPLPATFAPGESATFTLTYAPTTVGPVSGSVAVKSEQGRPVSVVDISGNGVPPTPEPTPEPTPVPVPATLAASPTRVDFGQVTVGSFNAQGVTLTNRTSEPIAVSEILTAGSGFTTSGVTAGATLAPGASATLTTRFTPAAQGTASGRVTLRTAGQTEPLAVVDLAGSGVAAASITSVTVRDTTVETSKTVQVQADVVAVGTIDKSLTWSVDPASLGTIDPVTGVYSAPAAPGTYRVWAASNADPSKKGSGSIVVTSAPPQPSEPPPTLPFGVVPAFRGAEGGGALSKGGRGGTVYLVTNLNDSGAGSLRACLAATGPRTCIFTTGGTIQLSSGLSVTNPYLTIAGQTAPGGGIALGCRNTTNDCLTINTHNVVVRYVRVRHGYNGSTPDNQGGKSIMLWEKANNVILDHVSASWGQDETLTAWAAPGMAPHDITVQHSMIYEGVYNAVGDHNNASIFGGATDSATQAAQSNIDLHHNLFASAISRLPNISAGSGSFVNNLVFNYHWYALGLYKGVNWDIIGNRFKAGTMTYAAGDSRAVPVSLWIYNLFAGVAAPSVYMNGNTALDGSVPTDQWSLSAMKQVEGSACVDQNGGATSSCLPIYSGWRRSSPRAKPSTYVAITASSAAGAESALLATGGVGASARLDCNGAWVDVRDAQDARILSDYSSGSGIGATYTTEAAVGGFPSLAAGTACADADRDGIPDAFETGRCGSATCLDANAVQTDGYTNLEQYLNGR